jgi:DNA (cytosine-5)-methyltransferase 1
MGYYYAGYTPVGIDINPQPNYPFEFIQEDVTNLTLLRGFDLIHASPPCQRWSSKTMRAEEHPDLITPLRPLLQDAGVPYVIENVPGAPLADPIQLCGSAFGLGVQRHRLFESNASLSGVECNHGAQPKKYRVYDHGKWYMSRVVPVYGNGGGKAKEHWAEAMGIDWMTHVEMAEAIPPAYTQYLGEQLLEVM